MKKTRKILTKFLIKKFFFNLENQKKINSINLEENLLKFLEKLGRNLEEKLEDSSNLGTWKDVFVIF